MVMRLARCVVVDREEDVVQHEAAAQKPSEFRLKDHRSQGVSHHTAVTTMCTHLFTEELAWMEDSIRGVMEGVLSCPRCAAKLGTFSWVGIRCSCGRWQVPGLALLRSKIDILTSPDPSGAVQ